MLSFKKKEKVSSVLNFTQVDTAFNKISKIEKKMRIDLLKMSNYTNYQIEPSWVRRIQTPSHL